MERAAKIILILGIIAVFFVGSATLLYLLLGGEMYPYAQVINIDGTISTGGSASPGNIIPKINAANDDPMAKVIILKINSPGGTVVASKEIAEAVASSEKPVVAWIRELGASGAYWIASSSDAIVADPASITGSIGVTASYLQYEGLFEKYGIGYERLVTGKYKDTSTPYRDMTSDERTLMMNKLNKLNDMFIRQVAQSRKMDYSKVAGLATGEIYLGIEAYENGLVDHLGGSEKAVEVAETLAGEQLDVVNDYSSSLGWLELFSQKAFYWFGQGFADALFKLTEQTNAFTA